MFQKTMIVLACLVTQLPYQGSASAHDESRGYKHVPITAPIVYDQMCIIATSDKGSAVFVLTGAFRNGQTFKYRYLPKGRGDEQAGNGSVFEDYERSKDGSITGDGGSQLWLSGGPIRVQWSRGSDDAGWFYYTPETLRVQVGKATDFDSISLQRFNDQK